MGSEGDLMITIIDAQQRYYVNHGWSQVYCLFPANSTHDLARTSQDLSNYFGNILLINDYTIAPNCGYDMHPHQNLEQIFIVIKGELTHKDSLNNHLVLTDNSVQRITAGSGYARSNHNYTGTPARYLGIWFMPKKQNAEPQHEVRNYPPKLWSETFYPVASDNPKSQSMDDFPTILFNAGATVYRVKVKEKALNFTIEAHQKALLYVTDGSITCQGQSMPMGSHARILGKEKIQLQSTDYGECVFIVISEER